jgi:hypothetical protein
LNLVAVKTGLAACLHAGYRVQHDSCAFVAGLALRSMGKKKEREKREPSELGEPHD